MRKMNFCSLVLSLFVLCALFVPVHAEKDGIKDAIYDLVLDSQGVYVVNTQTGTAIYEKAENSRMLPASTTKIMTALVVLEECEDPKNETITVPDAGMFQYIIDDGGVNMQLLTGEVFTVYDILLGMMMNSYCDAADLLAYHFGDGDVGAFVGKMNEKAEDLGLENTHFENPHGLHAQNHYSSPRDIATFFGEALKNPLFREIISTRSYTIPATQKSPARPLKYTVDIYYEKSDYYLEAFVGGKSGFTDPAGRCLATYSEKDGISYISVLLGANMDQNKNYRENMAWVETNLLISYAYENFEVRTVVEKGEKLANLPVTDSESSLPVVAGEDIRVLTRKGSEPGWSLSLPESISAKEVQDGFEVGKVILTYNGEKTESSYPLLLSWDGVPVVTKSTIQKGAESAWSSVSGIFRTDPVFVWLLILLVIIIAICIPAMKITQILHKKKSHRPKH